MEREQEKLIVIIAGPNGAGKTTFAKEYLSNELGGMEFINADEIAAGLCPEDVESVAVKAGRIMLEQIAERLDAGRSFAIETTLSGRAFARAIPKWRELGYEVTLHFISLRNPEGSIRRVAARVEQGGHHIPEEVIRRRFDKGLHNFYTVYKELVNHWFLWDNSMSRHILVESGGSDLSHEH